MPSPDDSDLSAAAPSSKAPTVENAGAFGAGLEARSAEIEELRRLPDDVVAGLVQLGVFRMWIPERYGGFETPLHEGLRILRALSYWDGALGWCAMIGASTALQAAYLPAEWAERIYGDPAVVTGGVAEPRGVAVVAEGGMRATGRWAWGSGTSHCQWIGGGCLVRAEAGEDAAPRHLFCFFEREQVELLDTWHTSGLRGTASTDFAVEDAFVPEGRWVERGVDPPRVDRPLYKFPHLGLLALGVGCVGLGLARRALDELRDVAVEKRYVGSRRTLAQRPAVQASFAEAEASLLAAEALLDRVVDEAWQAAIAGGLEDEHRRRLRLAATQCMRSAVGVVTTMTELAGGTAVYRSSPLQRLLRDVYVAASHGMVAPRTYEITGRMALGLETDTRQL
jgi:alkylation response protein AidB-like acyl-CoA dehydrogenase